jgi:DnaK suppressor protein
MEVRSVQKQTTGATQYASILAMPEADYMNKAQLSFFAGILRKKQVELIDATTVDHGVLDECQMASDPIDRACTEEERNTAHAKRINDLRQLSEVTRSLAKILSGDYGYSDVTGDPIGLQRLLAKPTANLTVEEQMRREKRLARMCG